MTERSFSDQVIQAYAEKDKLANCRSVTFQVTDDCCLHCSYCYQINKQHNMMTKEIAKKIVDLLFQMYDEDNENTIINKHTKGIILDFIGGEPFINIDVIEFTSDYFFNRCVKEQHLWLMNSMIQITTNGMLYFDTKVQSFIKKYKNMLSLTITLDGPKQLHDACRVDYNGNGSFDTVIKAWQDWKTKVYPFAPSTKITIAPENLPYLSTIFDFFLDNGVTSIYANPIFEHNWTIEEAQEYYKQLKILADRLLKNTSIYSSLFDNGKGLPMPLSENRNWCGGTGLMLAFDPFGTAYPCLRYMPSSLGETREPIIIGNYEGIYQTKKEKKIQEMLAKITRLTQSPEECINCQVASGCGWCSAYNYQETGSINKRSTYICWMHRAEALVNSYYWNNYYRLHNIHKHFPMYLQRDIATKIITNEEYDMLLTLSLY